MAPLSTQAGDAVGVVTFTPDGNGVQVRAEVTNLPPGWHGFHVHTNGVCDPSTQFTSAGGHLNLGNAALPDGGMNGDMTNLYVQSDGSGVLVTRVDRFSIADLLADGGRSAMVHADADNFRNIPSRYNVTVDETTMNTGDAGARIACGVIQPS